MIQQKILSWFTQQKNTTKLASVLLIFILTAGILVSCTSYTPGKSIVGKAAHDGEADDTDGDGIPDKDDGDIDGDGKSNGKDGDADGDGIRNEDDPSPHGPDSHCDGSGKCGFYGDESQ